MPLRAFWPLHIRIAGRRSESGVTAALCLDVLPGEGIWDWSLDCFRHVTAARGVVHGHRHSTKLLDGGHGPEEYERRNRRLCGRSHCWYGFLSGRLAVLR